VTAGSVLVSNVPVFAVSRTGVTFDCSTLKLVPFPSQVSIYIVMRAGSQRQDRDPLLQETQWRIGI
jgi:hypothetical protein